MTIPLPDFDKEEQELLARLRFVREEKERIAREEKERIAKEVGIILNVELSRFGVEIKAPYDVNLLDIYHKIKGRWFNEVTKVNGIPFLEWRTFLTLLEEEYSKHTKYTIIYGANVEQKLNEILDGPRWTITLAPRNLVATPSPLADSRVLFRIPGILENVRQRNFNVPLTEAITLFTTLENLDKVEWSSEALELVREQIRLHGNMDRIAALEEDVSYMALDLCGNKLRKFQSVGSAFLEAGKGGLLADEVGLGKTWTAIAVAVKNNWRTLVITSASLIPNIRREIINLTGKVPVTLSGAIPSKPEFVSLLQSTDQFTLINYEIIGRATDTIENDKKVTKFLWAEALKLFGHFDCVIVDEIHYIKNVDSNRSKAVRVLNEIPNRIGLTGTPITNYVPELWPVLNFLKPQMFPSNDTFIRNYTFDGKHLRNSNELRQVLRGIMIRRLKRDVVAQLPPLNIIKTLHELSPKATRLYKRVFEGIFEAAYAYSVTGEADPKEVPNILVQIQRLKQVCAIDKVDATAEQAQKLYDETDPSEDRKVIIFTQFKAVAYAIWQRLADDGALSFVTRGDSDFVTADASERFKLVDQFQNDPSVKYLIVTEKTLREGHNATAAGHIVFNDLFWTPSAHTQAIGRAYGRLSNLHSINAVFMVTDMDGQSIEEWIMALLERKRLGIDAAVEGIETERDSSIGIDLIRKIAKFRK